MEKKFYTIVYFQNGRFFMISSNCFKTRDVAEHCANGFLEGKSDRSSWSFDIEELTYYEF